MFLFFVRQNIFLKESHITDNHNFKIVIILLFSSV